MKAFVIEWYNLEESKFWKHLDSWCFIGIEKKSTLNISTSFFVQWHVQAATSLTSRPWSVLSVNGASTRISRHRASVSLVWTGPQQDRTERELLLTAKVQHTFKLFHFVETYLVTLKQTKTLTDRDYTFLLLAICRNILSLLGICLILSIILWESSTFSKNK